jgi:hypothetical protein
MIRPVLLALSLVAATEAAALTCLPADPIRDFREAQAAPESYHILHGRLSFDPSLMPQGVSDDPGVAPNPVDAQFEGFALGPEGFTKPVEAEVILQSTCAGPYCGTFGPGEALLFAEITDTGYLVRIGPCGGGAFDQVSQDTLDGLAACLRGESCGPEGRAAPPVKGTP